jgi:transcriptional regulator with XRE-family HTH domain
MTKSALGELLRKWREEERISLRKFASDLNMDPSNYSRIERGVGPRPSEDVLERIARRFGIVPGVDARWFELVNAASADRGEFPQDLLEQEEIRACLPAFFRRLRSDGLGSTESMYDVFVQVLKER